MIKCLGFASNHAVSVDKKWPCVANYCRMVMGPCRILILTSLPLWGLFEIFHNNYSKEDFNGSDINALSEAPWMVNEVLGVGSEH